MPIEECPSCLAPMPARAVYCPRCGQPRTAGAMPPAPSSPVSRSALATAAVVHAIALIVGITMNRLAASEGATAVASFGLVLATIGVLGSISVSMEAGKRRRQRHRVN